MQVVYSRKTNKSAIVVAEREGFDGREIQVKWVESDHRETWWSEDKFYWMISNKKWNDGSLIDWGKCWFCPKCGKGFWFKPESCTCNR